MIFIMSDQFTILSCKLEISRPKMKYKSLSSKQI